MDARKCDRCGQFYAVGKDDRRMSENDLRLLKAGEFDWMPFDLCKDCKKSLDDWTKEIQRREEISTRQG